MKKFRLSNDSYGNPGSEFNFFQFIEAMDCLGWCSKYGPFSEEEKGGRTVIVDGLGAVVAEEVEPS